MEIETQIRYRENKNTQNVIIGTFRVPQDIIPQLQKDAMYKIKIEKIGEPEKAKQGRRKNDRVRQPESPETASAAQA